MRDLVIIANSPGELAALAKPVIKQAKQQMPEARIIVVLTPCQYNSGQEIDYLRSIKEISVIITSAEYQKWIFLSQLPQNLVFAPKGAVVFLGGDLMHAILIAKKLKYPAYAYLINHIGGDKVFSKFFVADQKTKDKLSKKIKDPNKIIVTGDLMVNSMSTSSLEKIPQLDPSRPVVTFMPGSRQWQIKYMVPLNVHIAKHLKTLRPDIQLALSASPFAPVAQTEPFDALVPLNALNLSTLAVGIPGTNTAQLAILGIPMLVIFPLDHPDDLPLEGLAHYIGKIPVLGKMLKQLALYYVNKKTKYFAIPNIKADREIYPEVRGKIDPAQIAVKIDSMLKDKSGLEKISAAAKIAMGPAGAAQKIIEEIKHANI